MLDLSKMIETNDFTSLINSTKEDRQGSGGCLYIFNELMREGVCKDLLNEIAHTINEDDTDMLTSIKTVIGVK